MYFFLMSEIKKRERERELSLQRILQVHKLVENTFGKCVCSTGRELVCVFL